MNKMHLIVDKLKGTVTVIEMDGRRMNDSVRLSSKIGQLLLKTAYTVSNGTVEYKE